MSVYSHIKAINAEALTIDPARFLLAVLAAPFVVVGTILRVVWMVPAFCYAAAVYGWRKSDEAVKAQRAKARH